MIHRCSAKSARGLAWALLGLTSGCSFFQYNCGWDYETEPEWNHFTLDTYILVKILQAVDSHRNQEIGFSPLNSRKARHVYTNVSNLLSISLLLAGIGIFLQIDRDVSLSEAIALQYVSKIGRFIVGAYVFLGAIVVTIVLKAIGVLRSGEIHR